MTSIALRKKKWYDLQDMSSPVRSTVQISYHPKDLPPRPWPYRQFKQGRIDWAVREYERRMEVAAWLDDDYVPMAAPYTGTEIIAEAFGCPVHEAKDNMPFARPALYAAAEVAKLSQPRVQDSCVMELFEIARAIRERVGPEAPMMLPDIQSPVDIAALILEKAAFLTAMIEEPEAVKALSAMTEAFLTEFLTLWFDEFGYEYAAHFPAFPRKGGFSFSEDEIGEFSAAMFEEFCLPGINRMSERFGGCAVHCCANARHQWEGLKQIKGLRVLNLVQPIKILERAIASFGCDVVHWHMVSLDDSYRDTGDVQPWVHALPHGAHAVLEVGAVTRDEALSKLERLRALEAKRGQ